jgi:RNA polymerase sigma-70 factor, ECF subfamily
MEHATAPAEQRDAPAAPRRHDPPDRTLESLLVAAAEGDTASFAQLCDVIAPTVYGLAQRVSGDVALAERIAHAALLDVWATCPRYDPARETGRAWVTGVAHRRAVATARSVQSMTDRLARRTVPVSAHADGDEVAQALRTLPEAQRQAVSLAFYDGCSLREVAAILDVPVRTATERIRDGLRLLEERCAGVESAALLRGTSGRRTP